MVNFTAPTSAKYAEKLSRRRELSPQRAAGQFSWPNESVRLCPGEKSSNRENWAKMAEDCWKCLESHPKWIRSADCSYKWSFSTHLPLCDRPRAAKKSSVSRFSKLTEVWEPKCSKKCIKMRVLCLYQWFIETNETSPNITRNGATPLWCTVRSIKLINTASIRNPAGYQFEFLGLIFVIFPLSLIHHENHPLIIHSLIIINHPLIINHLFSPLTITISIHEPSIQSSNPSNLSGLKHRYQPGPWQVPTSACESKHSLLRPTHHHIRHREINNRICLNIQAKLIGFDHMNDRLFLILFVGGINHDQSCNICRICVCHVSFVLFWYVLILLCAHS